MCILKRLYKLHQTIVDNSDTVLYPGYWTQSINQVGKPETHTAAHAAGSTSQSIYAIFLALAHRASFCFLQYPHREVPYIVAHASLRQATIFLLSSTLCTPKSQSPSCTSGTIISSCALSACHQEELHHKSIHPCISMSMNSSSFFIFTNKAVKNQYYLFYTYSQKKIYTKAPLP